MAHAKEWASQPCPDCHLPLMHGMERHWLASQSWVLKAHRCTAKSPPAIVGFDITETRNYKNWKRRNS